MTKRSRLDVALVERGLVLSREKAQRLIMAGQVRLKGAPATKASQGVVAEDLVEVVAGEKFVSRGGLKLEAALERLGVEAQGLQEFVCASPCWYHGR